MKYLILNADDFGMSKVFNEVILDLIKDNKVSSTSVMVNDITDEMNEQINELIRLKKTKNISVGLHLDFYSISYDEEIQEQYDKFLSIFDFTPDHIDKHRSRIHNESLSNLIKFSIKNNIPCRNKGPVTKEVKTTTERFCGTFVKFEKVKEWLNTLKDNNYYEIYFHPGKYDPNCDSSLNKDREKDVEKILKLNTLLSKYNIKLTSYSEFAATFR